MPTGIYKRTEWHKARCGFTLGHTRNLGKPSPTKGRKLSEEHKRKVSMSLLGKKRPEEVKKKISQSHIGLRPNKAVRMKMSESHKGKSPANKGIPKSEECKNKIRAKKMCVPWSKKRRETQRRKWEEGVFKGRKNVYPELWDSIRQEVYKRDKWICQECECKCNNNSVRYKRKLIQCHHIDYDTSNNDMSNLITLCLSCHAKTNFKRKDWEKYFQTKMKENKHAANF